MAGIRSWPPYVELSDPEAVPSCKLARHLISQLQLTPRTSCGLSAYHSEILILSSAPCPVDVAEIEVQRSVGFAIRPPFFESFAVRRSWMETFMHAMAVEHGDGFAYGRFQCPDREDSESGSTSRSFIVSTLSFSFFGHLSSVSLAS